MFLTRRPNLTANSAVWVACIIFKLGFRPIIQAGKKVEANSDLECLGGRQTINLLSLPCAMRLNFSARIL